MTEQSGDRFVPEGRCTCAGPDGPCEACVSNLEAYREWQAERATPPTPEQAGPSGEAYSAMSWNGFNVFGDEKSIREVARTVHVAGTAPQLQDEIKRLRAALSSPGAMEGAQAAQPLTDRQQRVVTFALSRFASGARSRAEAAAQDKQERYFKPGDVAAFLRDAEDAEALLKVALLRAHPPTGEPT